MASQCCYRKYNPWACALGRVRIRLFIHLYLLNVPVYVGPSGCYWRLFPLMLKIPKKSSGKTSPYQRFHTFWRHSTSTLKQMRSTVRAAVIGNQSTPADQSQSRIFFYTVELYEKLYKALFVFIKCVRGISQYGYNDVRTHKVPNYFQSRFMGFLNSR